MNNIKRDEKQAKNIKPLYSCESIVDSSEYKKMAKYFPNKIYWNFVTRGAILNLIISAIIAVLTKKLITTLVFFVIYQIYLMILYYARLEHFAEKVFIARNKKRAIETNFKFDFYNNYLVRKDNKSSMNINYSDISRCVENDTNFYFYYPQRNIIIIIQKNECELELINFIREKFKSIENYLGDKSNFKGVKKHNNQAFIKNFMIILFILTILSLYGALYSMSLVDKMIPQHEFNFTKNSWVFWCWLPIPILSVILGFKYKKLGFKCTKNIVGGFVIGFLLLIYGMFCLLPTFSQDYNKIEIYKDIIDAKLPSEGELEIQDWGTYFDDDKTNYTIINAYYDKEDVDKLINSIENNNNWILSKEIKSELKILIPSQLKADGDAYFSIYNKTTNQYNTLPKVSGNYDIYAMKYDISDKHLEIHSFSFLFK